MKTFKLKVCLLAFFGIIISDNSYGDICDRTLQVQNAIIKRIGKVEKKNLFIFSQNQICSLVKKYLKNIWHPLKVLI